MTIDAKNGTLYQQRDEIRRQWMLMEQALLSAETSLKYALLGEPVHEYLVAEARQSIGTCMDNCGRIVRLPPEQQ